VPATRERALAFVKQNFDRLAERLPRDAGGQLLQIASGFCDEAHRSEAEQFFRERSARFPGGPRELEQALEQVSQCAAYKRAQQASVVEFLRRF
jgi:alanyl aminopeptidase